MAASLQRTLTADDVNMVKMAMTGVELTVGSGDDVTIQLVASCEDPIDLFEVEVGPLELHCHAGRCGSGTADSYQTAFLPHVDEAMLRDLGARNRVLWAWIEGEYHQTPHRGLEGKTPIDRFLREQDHIRSAPEELERMMRMKVVRRASSTS